MALEVGSSLRRPRGDGDWLKKVVLGGIVSCVPVLNFAATGYVMKVMEAALEDDETERLPDWSDAVEHFFQGILPSLIATVYAAAGLVPLAIFMMSNFFLYGMKASTEKGFQAGVGGIVLAAVAGLVAFLLFMAIYGLIPMALSYYAQTADLAGTFRFMELVARIQIAPGDWAKVVLVSSVPVFLWGGLAFLPGGIWKQIPAMLVGFYCWVVAAQMAGQFARERFPLTSAKPAFEPAAHQRKAQDKNKITPGELTIDSRDLGSLEDLL